jgi:hypothetical protein
MTSKRFHLPIPLLSGFFGILLLLPASWFILTLGMRLCLGAKAEYRFIAPSFLQSPFDLFAWHKAQAILCCLLLAMICNFPAHLQWRSRRGRGWSLAVKPQGHWLNTAVAVQGLLLLVVLLLYTLIQHIRY